VSIKNFNMHNYLINETSPYLLQHAHQPVNWHPYSENVFELAKQEDKPLIISIGYSTCHWCHVMAHECFDDIEVAELMNNFFINVKVDREELPDVDRYYMNGLQVLTGRGGWPLNVFVLPNKKMFYGVTYLPKHNWIELLKKIHFLYQNEKEKLYQYANDLHQGITNFELSELSKYNSQNSSNIEKTKLLEKINEWKSLFDKEWGGHQYTPKFVMPINYKFFFTYNTLNPDKDIEQHLKTSIRNISLGGLFDHVDGGFYRYSTDRYWKIPHFEKMLYDNAQMIELLSLYYLQFNDEEIKWIAEKTIKSVFQNFYSDEGLFYSAWDADSEGEEGKFYTWTMDELKEIIDDFYEFAEIFNIKNQFGYWEHNKYVLTINLSLFYEDKNYWITKINQYAEKLNQYRKKRIPPSTDTKIITSWNALMIKALAIASVVFENPDYLDKAKKSLDILIQKTFINNQLFRIYHHSQTKNPAYLDDYAFLIDALITLSKLSADTNYLSLAISLSEIVINNFYSPSQKIFYYTNHHHSIQNSVELYDDVIPSANAQMINNLLYLSALTNEQHFKEIAENVFNTTFHLFFNSPLHSASYGLLLTQKLFFNDLEIVISGKDSLQYLLKLFPQIWFINNLYTSSKANNFSIFQNRFHSQKTFIYVCQHSACYEPIENTHHFNIHHFLHK